MPGFVEEFNRGTKREAQDLRAELIRGIDLSPRTRVVHLKNEGPKSGKGTRKKISSKIPRLKTGMKILPLKMPNPSPEFVKFVDAMLDSIATGKSLTQLARERQHVYLPKKFSEPIHDPRPNLSERDLERLEENRQEDAMVELLLKEERPIFVVASSRGHFEEFENRMAACWFHAGLPFTLDRAEPRPGFRRLRYVSSPSLLDGLSPARGALAFLPGWQHRNWRNGEERDLRRVVWEIWNLEI